LHPVIFENITHRYDGINVIKNFNLKIEEYLITVIIGKSGSGKSTLLQMINGLVKPSEGNMYVFGKKLDYARILDVRLNIGYSVQGTSLFPHMTAYENIALPGKIAGKSKDEIEKRIEQLMDMVELPKEFKTKYPYQLSGGEQQRVGICRAILLNPGIFLLDEAFGALDPDVKNEIHEKILKLQQIGPRTIIVVTHDMREAIRLGDRIVMLERGELQQYGTKGDILNNPANEFVKRFVSL